MTDKKTPEELNAEDLERTKGGFTDASSPYLRGAKGKGIIPETPIPGDKEIIPETPIPAAKKG